MGELGAKNNGATSTLAQVREALRNLDAAAHLGAVVARDDHAALAIAAQRDDRSSTSGFAITVKDWIDVAGLPCEGASDTRTGRVPKHDATAVARLKAAGAVVVAKTQPGAHHPIHGDCFHPLDNIRAPGGSSTGEAVLIAAGASPLGLGSDSGGSIRLPAAWCGIAGLKPSFGRVPTTGHFPRVGGRHDGRTVIGPLARRVADLVSALRLIAGPDKIDADCSPVALEDVTSVSPNGLRVAVVDEPAWQAAESTRAAVFAAASTLASLGCHVDDEPFPDHLDESLDVTLRYWKRADEAGQLVDQQLMDWDRFNSRMARLSRAVDVVIGPVVRDVAPLRRSLSHEDYIFTLPWSLCGWPAVSVPVGTDLGTGLPLAVQVAAPRWNDHVALAVASWLEGPSWLEGRPA